MITVIEDSICDECPVGVKAQDNSNTENRPIFITIHFILFILALHPFSISKKGIGITTSSDNDLSLLFPDL